MRWLVPTLLLSAGLAAVAEENGAAPASEGEKRIVFVLAEKEYRTLETVPAFFERELKPAGYSATFISAPAEGESKNDFPGLAQALQDADLCFISVRRRAPAAEDMAALKRFVADGKPVVAIRTSSHAFHLRGQAAAEGRELWEAFDPEVLGGNYHGHYGNEAATVEIDDKAVDHPILEGVGDLPASDKLYQAGPLADTATLLLTARIEGKPAEPVAWTNRAGENRARIFYTSLGQVSDFESADFRRLLSNAIAWAIGEE